MHIVAEIGLLGCKPASFSMEQNYKLALVEGALLEDPEKYCRLVGKMIYLTISRPELSYSVDILAQFLQSPREDHCEEALRVIRYLKGNPGQGVLLRSDSDL